MISPESRLSSAEAGTLLARRRTERGINLDQAAQALHLPRQVLIHLEEGRLDAFDARVYYLGHLRRYADWLGLDSKSLIERLGPLPAWNPRQNATLVEDAQENPWGSARGRWLSVVLGGVFLAAAVLIIMLYFANRPTHRPPIALSSRRPARARPGRISAAEPRIRLGVKPPRARASKPGPLVLEFSFEHGSWLEVEHAGRIVYAGLDRGGKTLTLRVAPPVRIHIGNAPAVRLTVNGVAFALAPWTGPKRVAVIRLPPLGKAST